MRVDLLKSVFRYRFQTAYRCSKIKEMIDLALNDNIKVALKKIILNIVNGDFSRLSSVGVIGRLSEEDMKVSYWIMAE